MNKESGFVWKLGMFVILGLLLLVVTIYFVGKQKNMFGSTFRLKSQFRSVSGLKAGNNVRFAGIDVGTVDDIEMVTDTCVTVNFVIRNEMRKFIKTDARVSIGSDGLMGDKMLIIYPGNSSTEIIKNDGVLASTNALEIEDIMQSAKKSVDNAGIITAQLAGFTYKMNNGKGLLSKLISDEEFGNSLKGTLMNLQTSSNQFAKFTYQMNNGKGPLSRLVNDEKMSNTLDSTISNLQSGSKAMSEDMEAAQHNILLRGFFKNKKKAEAKRLADLKKQEDLKKKNDLQNLKDSTKQ
jgi:phospholipid/cholesterol/gamma-HCH transport system substrate-binding protein